MNERIRELASQAENYAAEQSDKFGVSYKKEYNKKFAELIVRECAYIPIDMWDKAELNADIAVKIQNRIEEHFRIDK